MNKTIDPASPPPGYALKDVQLEMSLKPFYDTTVATRERVCREVFEQWRALTRHAETISIMLWIGDGSEILEYEGRADVEFEWGRYQGSANAHEWKLSRTAKQGNADENCTGVHAWDDRYDPEKKGLHRRAYLYRPKPARFTFAWLRDLVADLKRIGHEATGKKILVGETFDIGPEFAVSRFKYTWHPEILAGGNSLFKGQFISCEALLHADTRGYAGFPEGIPEGTSIGTFLGRQARCFFEDHGFDFLWLSNGFGFALEPWAMIGALFDGATFDPAPAVATSRRILGFWQDLRAEFPARYRIRTRGTNLCTGIDLGSDASPLRDIYAECLQVDAPVNSPWAALDGDFGLELSGWMSHIARHPGETFRFRYYIHDAWWKNSPYLDRYERNPHDIILPSAISRVQGDGSVEIARNIAFLSIDDSDGLMPLSVPNEVTAHLLRAREFAPDEAGPIVWAYPFDAFHELALGGNPQVPFHADLFIGTVINDSVPLNTVADLRELPLVLKAQPQFPYGRIFLSPVAVPGSLEESALLNLREAGGDLLLYGPIPTGSAFFDLLGLEGAEPIEGDFDLKVTPIPENEMSVPSLIRHTGFLSAGGWSERMKSTSASIALAEAHGKGQARTAAVLACQPSGGRIGWVRGSLATAEFDPTNPEPIRGPILRPMDPGEFIPCGRLCRFLLGAMGWRASVPDRATAQRVPYHTIHRHRGAFQYSGYHADENALLQLRAPLGAPLFTGRRLPVVRGATQVTGARAWSYEARVFLESGEDGIYRCRIQCPVGFGVGRRLLISGCRNARLVFLMDPEAVNPVRILRQPVFPYLTGEFVDPRIETSPWGPIIRIPAVQGDLLIEW